LQSHKMSESKILIISIWAALFFALLGTIWGVVVGSSMIIFDGVYSSTGIILGGLTLVVLKQIESEEEDQRFPFGKAHFEPLFIIFKSLLLIGMCVFSSINALSELLAGGRDVSANSAILYALISVIVCLFVTLFIHYKNKKINSNLLNVERNQWFGDLLISMAVLAGFSVAYLLQNSTLSWLIPYADPGLLFVVSSLFIVVPSVSFFNAFKEMIFYRVEPEIFDSIDNKAAEIAEELEAEYILRVVNIGREVNIELNFLSANRTFDVLEMDVIRNRILQIVKKMDKKNWININFTQDKAWL
jgi:predicted Co/Zn/Cd cation transporter (cation efflux family)